MVPTDFPGSNAVLTKPEELTDDECSPLCILNGIDSNGWPVIVSCWKFTEEEWLEVLKTKRVWLTVVSSISPPVHLSGIRPYE